MNTTQHRRKLPFEIVVLICAAILGLVVFYASGLSQTESGDSEAHLWLVRPMP